MAENRAVLVVADLLVGSRLEDSARRAGFTPVTRQRLGPPDEAAPAIVVVDLDAEGSLDDAPAWRERWPDLPIVGFVSHKDRKRWEAAEALGIRVVPRGATSSDARTIFGA